MNVWALLKILGRNTVEHQIKHSLDKHTSVHGKRDMAVLLDQAASGLKSGDDEAAAVALTSLLFSIH
jgi:hypothetical protein